MAAGADAGEDVVEAVREVAGDLFGRGPLVDLHVGGVVELHGQPGVRGRGHDFAGLGDGALHAEFARSEFESRRRRRPSAGAVDRERFGHDQDELVALNGGDEGQADAGVARGRLDDHAARLENAAPRRPRSSPGRCGP